MKKPKWVGLIVNCYEKELWELGVEETSYQANWLDFVLVIPILKYWLWQARTAAFCRGYEYAKNEAAK